MTFEEGKSIVDKLLKNVEIIIRGKKELIKLMVTGVIAGGHILLEDYPGCGKTTLAKTLSFSIGTSKEDQQGHIAFKRIQFTPDLLPSDLIGVNIYDQKNETFRFSPGPVFSNIVLADEINRSSPKVQSALLECMAEKQVTVDNETYKLNDFFFVIGTQNPLEIAGTYPLPLVQLDRFLMKLDIGYIDAETELEVLKDYNSIISKPDNVKKVCNGNDILEMKELADSVFCEEEVYDCIIDIIHKTRTHPAIHFGASTRSAIMLLKAVKAYAFVEGRDFVIEDDIKKLSKPVLYHRLQFNEGAKNPVDLLELLISHSVEKMSLSNKKFIRKRFQ